MPSLAALGNEEYQLGKAMLPVRERKLEVIRRGGRVLLGSFIAVS
jgi:hypothetical protein